MTEPARDTSRVPGRRDTQRATTRLSARRMRVLVVAPALELNGLTLYAATLMRALKEQNHKVQLAAQTGPLLATLDDACDSYVELESRLGFFGWRRVLESVREFNPEILHVVAPEPGLPHARLSRALGVPMVVSVHGIKPEEMPPVGGEGYGAFIASDQSVRQRLLNECRLERERTTLISDCVFPEQPPTEQEVLDPRRRQVVGWIGPVDTTGEHETLVKACEIVNARVPDTMFSILGSGPGMPGLRAMVDDRGLQQRVVVIEQLYDYSRIWQPFDIAVVDTHQRASGQMVLHAMANGLPVIAGEGGAVFDLVEDGVDGVIVPRNDPHALAERILKLVEDPSERLRMGRAGFRKVEEGYRPAAMAQACAGVYDALLRGEPLPRNPEPQRK
jgi:glycosyltransferase involved in cell wall biosynthesis